MDIANIIYKFTMDMETRYRDVPVRITLPYAIYLEVIQELHGNSGTLTSDPSTLTGGSDIVWLCGNREVKIDYEWRKRSEE